MDAQSRIQVAVLQLKDREYPLYKGVNVIGRNKAAIVNIVNLNVSQNHAVIIEVDETQHYISDLNSSNGTFLNGGKLKSCQLYDLNDDSHIIIGNVDARYHKLPRSIVATNTTVDTSNTTQSMSQSMYACNTQLITDETIVDSTTRKEGQLHLRSIPPPPKFVPQNSHTNRESQPIDIHEIATQVMLYPERRSPLPQCPVQLSAKTGIHDEATQEVDLPGSSGRNAQSQESNLNLQNPDNVHSNHLDEDSEATDIGSQGSEQLLMTKQPVFHNRHRYHDSQEPSTSTAKDQQKIVDDSFQEANAGCDNNVVVEESFDNVSKVSDDLLTEFPTGELEMSLDEDESPVTGKLLGRQRLRFDSPPQEGMQKRRESNESQKLGSDNRVDSNRDENDAEDIVATKKKPLSKLDSTQESDSDTDIECSPVIGNSQMVNAVQKSRNAVIGSDSDNDIENRNENVSNVVNNHPCGLDSDTKIEDKATNKVDVLVKNDKGEINTTQVDSHIDKNGKEPNDNLAEKKDETNESNCARIEDTEKKVEPSGKTVDDTTDTTGDTGKNCQTAVESDSDTDIEDDNHAVNDKVDKDTRNHVEIDDNASSKNISAGFNESDCIPATQDAFALAFNYDQRIEKVSNDSEESFKLGLTELMEGSSQHSERARKNPDRCDADVDKTDGRQRKDEQVVGKKTIGQRVDKDTGNVQESDEGIGMKAQNIDVPDEEDEAYIMATQKLEIPSNSSESEQFKMPSKKFTFKKKVVQLDQSITTMLSSQSEDMYTMPTQKLKEENASQKGTSSGDDRDDDNEDVYIAATQVFEQNMPKEVDDTVYILPTQKLNSPSTDYASKNEDADGVMRSLDVEEKKDAERGPKKCDLDDFDAPTQVIESDESISVISESGKHDRVFDLPTQVFSPSNRSSLRKVERNSEKSITKSLRQITASTAEDRPESLSQIEAFIKQPLNEDMKDSSDQKNALPASTNSKIISTRRVRRKESLDKTNHPTEVIFSKASTDDQNASSTSDKIRKDMIQNIISSVSSKDSDNFGNRSKRKVSCVSETNEATVRTVKSSKLQTKEERDKRSKVDKSEESAENIESPTEIVGGVCELDTHKKVLNVLDNNKTGTKSNTRSTRRLRSKEQGKNLAASKSDDNTEAKSEDITSFEEKKKPQHRSKRKTESSCDREKSPKHDGSTKSRSPDRDKAEEPHVAEEEIVSVPSSSKRGKSCKRTATATEANTTSEIRASKRITRKNSRELGPETELDKKETDRKTTRQIGGLEAIPEIAPASAENDNLRIDSPTTPQFVSRNKRKNESSGSRISEKMPRLDKADLNDSKLGKSNGCEKLSATVSECESVEKQSSACTAAQDTVTSRSRSRRKAVAVSIKNAGVICSADSADDEETSTLAAPRDLSASLSTPEKNKRRQKPKVVFTMLDSPQLESFIKHLGGSVVDSVDGCSVLVTENVKRSMKLLVAVGLAKPICSPSWIRASKDAREFLDPWDYILVDEAAESKWDFSLKESLERASRKKLFENYAFQVMATNAVDVLKGAIQSCGGKCLTRKPSESTSNLVVVATADQKSKFRKIQGQVPNVLVVEPEAIFDGVLRQEIRFSEHLLT